MKLYPKSAKGLVLGLLRIALVVYLAVTGLLVFFQESLIFRPSILEPGYKYSFDRAFEERWLNVEGQKVDSLLFRAPSPKGTILFFHGNAGSLADWGEVASEIVGRTQWNVWIADYPGYGRSEGKITSEEQLHQLAKELLTQARAEFGASERIAIYGRSVGSGIAVKLATENPVAALVLESPFYSLKKLASELFPWAPTSFIRYTFRSDKWIKEVKAPVLIIHGDRDEIIPFGQGQRLAKGGASVQFMPIVGGRHNDLSAFADYWDALSKFLDELI